MPTSSSSSSFPSTKKPTRVVYNSQSNSFSTPATSQSSSDNKQTT
jgi:hypothetical protein